jgi:hypothetical protein
MRFYACQNEECNNKGAPYHDHEPDEVIVLCPLCSKAMTVIPAPDLKPPQPESEGGE